MPTLDEALDSIVNEEIAKSRPRPAQARDFAGAFLDAAMSTDSSQGFNPRANQGIKRSSLQESIRAAADPRTRRGPRAAQYQSALSNLGGGAYGGGGVGGQGAPPGYGGGPMASGLGPTGPGGVGGGGSATRSFAPYNLVGKGDAKSGFEFLQGLAMLGGGNKELANAIAGARSGFGSVNVILDRGADTPNLDINKFSSGNPKNQPISIPTYAGTFKVYPSEGTRELGMALTAIQQRSADIRYRQASKANRRRGFPR